MTDKETFIALTETLTHGLLREAIGYSVEYKIPYYRGIVGYMVEAPMLWIRHTRFPIFYIAYDRRSPEVLLDVVKQVEMARATEYFALLIVVPTREGTGNEAEELRHIVADSVYRYDFVVLDRQHLASIVALSSSQRLIEIILSQGIELSTLSPYILKGPVSEKMFFGREREIKTISQTIHNGDFAIAGGRRIGKSSTLLKVLRIFNNDPHYHPSYINCEEMFDYENFFQILGADFNQPVDSPTPLAFRRVAAGIKSTATATQLVFLLDEVDELLDYDAHSKPSGQLFKTFRALSHEGVCRFIFSGSRVLYKHLRNPGSPFFNFCEGITLKPLEAKSIAEIVSKPMHQLGIELPDEKALIDRIIDLTSSHPHLAQWVCDRLVRRASARSITINDLEEIVTEPEFNDHFIQTAWGEATPLEKVVSLVMEGPTFRFDDITQTLARYGITNRSAIRDAVDILQVYALLERQGKQYGFMLSQFPRIAREMDDFSSQIDNLVTQVEK